MKLKKQVVKLNKEDIAKAIASTPVHKHVRKHFKSLKKTLPVKKYL